MRYTYRGDRLTDPCNKGRQLLAMSQKRNF
jgi:hypothetical protein